MDVLLVEDHRDVRLALTELLEVEGYRVTSFATAEEALAAAKPGTFAMAITDQALPGESGTWLLQQLRDRKLFDGPALVITASAMMPEVEGVRLLRKPMDLDQFVAEVRAATRRRVHLRFYFVSGTRPSHHARRNLEALLARYDAGDLTVQFFDLAEGVPEEAEEDRVLGTPALRLTLPSGEKTWLVGDLSDPGRLALLLEAAGVRRRFS